MTSFKDVMSVGNLVGFDWLLRTSELLQPQIADIVMTDQLTPATINLPDHETKRARHRELSQRANCSSHSSHCTLYTDKAARLSKIR